MSNVAEMSKINYSSFDYGPVFRQVIQPFVSIIYTIFFICFTVLLAALIYALMKYRLNPFRLRVEALRTTPIRFQLFNFLRWIYIDLDAAKRKGIEFDEYGFTIYVGRQGGGKTTSMVQYLNRMHRKFPDALIVTNFKYKYATHIMKDWRDLFTIRNGTKGVIFAIDEIHSEYSNEAWKDFPEELLSEISQQRKQRIKIVCTSQVYTRVVKQIREQCFTVVQCKTFGNRWTFNKEYDAYEYEECGINAVKRKKLSSIRRSSFVQSDFLRSCFDTYEKIQRLEKMDFLTRDQKAKAS